jgi:hypothetical protein
VSETTEHPVGRKGAFIRVCDCLWLILAGATLMVVPILLFFGVKAMWIEYKHSDPGLRAFMKECVVAQDKPATRCKELHRWR